MWTIETIEKMPEPNDTKVVQRLLALVNYLAKFIPHLSYTVEPRYNAVVGVHDFGPCCKRGALGVLISATRELLNNSDRRPLQVHEPCRSPVCLQHCLRVRWGIAPMAGQSAHPANLANNELCGSTWRLIYSL